MMKTPAFSILFLTGSLLLAACQGSNTSSALQMGEGDSIVGGSVASSRDFGRNTLVSLRRKATDGIFCTGSLIHSRIVLTAAHCLKASGLNAEDIVIGFAANPEARVDVDAAESHDGFQMNAERSFFGGSKIRITGDVALLRLVRSAPQGAQIADLPRAAVKPGQNIQVKIFGYGKTDYRQTGVDGNLRLVDKAAFVESETPHLLIDDETDGHGTCSGDSGGPSFLIGAKRPTVMAVVSATLSMGGFLSGRGQDVCRQKNGLTQTGYYLDWLLQKKAELLSQ